MRSTTPQRQLPPFDRRQHRRFLTLRNFRNALLVALATLAVLNIRSEMRDTTGGEYGRLYGRGIESVPEVEARGAAPAAAVDEAASADPFSVDAARREQYLGNASLEPVPLLDPAVDTTAYTRRPSDSGVSIVGGPEGVAIVTEEARHAPALGGGFGRRRADH